MGSVHRSTGPLRCKNTVQNWTRDNISTDPVLLYTEAKTFPFVKANHLVYFWNDNIKRREWNDGERERESVEARELTCFDF